MILPIAVCTPSRGLVHSRTIESVLREMATTRTTGWFLSHDLPLPDCHNAVADLALESGARAIWFVEEDMVPPLGALTDLVRLLESGADIAAFDYPISEQPSYSSVHHVLAGDRVLGDQILFCGMGCTLIKRAVFDAMERPFFRSDYRVEHYRRGLSNKLTPELVDEPHPYGGQDVYFGFMAMQLGFTIARVKPRHKTCGHAHVRKLGGKTNDGVHTIEVLTKIDEWL